MHFVDRVGGVAGGQLNLDQRVLRAEAIEDRRQVAVRRGHRTEQPQFAAQRRAVLAERVLQLLILQQRLLGEFFQLFAGVGQLHGTVVAQKQRLPRISSSRWIWRESVDGLTCIALAVRPK